MSDVAAWRARSLPREFYCRQVVEVARELIGMVLVHVERAGLSVGRIVETEAYRGPEDLAAHTANGRRTRRNEAMWGRGGHAYLFRLYGVHWAFNAVTGHEGEPHAVLVRAVEPLAPRDLICARRGLPESSRQLASGPGKLCAAFGLDERHYGMALYGRSPLFIARGDDETIRIGRSPRIHIDYAGVWAKRPWRFYLRGNRHVSVAPRD